MSQGRPDWSLVRRALLVWARKEVSVNPDDVEATLAAVVASTTTINVLDQAWKVTPFHCLVGPVGYRELADVTREWETCWPTYEGTKTSALLGGIDPFCYVTAYERLVGAHRDAWKDRAFLFYTNNPLVVNKMKLGEVSLAVVEHGKVRPLPREPLVERLKVYELGETLALLRSGWQREVAAFRGTEP